MELCVDGMCVCDLIIKYKTHLENMPTELLLPFVLRFRRPQKDSHTHTDTHTHTHVDTHGDHLDTLENFDVYQGVDDNGEKVCFPDEIFALELRFAVDASFHAPEVIRLAYLSRETEVKGENSNNDISMWPYSYCLLLRLRAKETAVSSLSGTLMLSDSRGGCYVGPIGEFDVTLEDIMTPLRLPVYCWAGVFYSLWNDQSFTSSVKVLDSTRSNIHNKIITRLGPFVIPPCVCHVCGGSLFFNMYTDDFDFKQEEEFDLPNWCLEDFEKENNMPGTYHSYWGVKEIDVACSYTHPLYTHTPYTHTHDTHTHNNSNNVCDVSVVYIIIALPPYSHLLLCVSSCRSASVVRIRCDTPSLLVQLDRFFEDW
eukprot:GHVR01117487.1.p1 GENE.GHVR01117487.1~~GHVR01117487.1.p1  ORF type:complete len:369 (-),score=118.26 GHVR01117487.1:414-1520(-)